MNGEEFYTAVCMRSVYCITRQYHKFVHSNSCHNCISNYQILSNTIKYIINHNIIHLIHLFIVILSWAETKPHGRTQAKPVWSEKTSSSSVRPRGCTDFSRGIHGFFFSVSMASKLVERSSILAGWWYTYLPLWLISC